MITFSVTATALRNVAESAMRVMQKDGEIRLGMFVYSLKHGRKYKYGTLLEPHHEQFSKMDDGELLKVYEFILGCLDHAFPGMTCGVDRWRFEFGYTATPMLGPSGLDATERAAQRRVDLSLGLHPDARTSTRGTRLPGTTWFLPRMSRVKKLEFRRVT